MKTNSVANVFALFRQTDGLTGRRHARIHFARLSKSLPLAGEELWLERTAASRQASVLWLHAFWSPPRARRWPSPTPVLDTAATSETTPAASGARRTPIRAAVDLTTATTRSTVAPTPPGRAGRRPEWGRAGHPARPRSGQAMTTAPTRGDRATPRR